MDWLIGLFTNNESMAHIALLYAVVIAVGIYLGKIKVGGISLGVTFVLFAGILAGHVGFTAPTSTLTFMQDFGLILFVFMIGLQVGPGFFSSFKEGGLTLNILATSLILLNIAVMFACYFAFFDINDPANLPMMIGTLYGAVTNTPGLGAAQEALSSIMGNNTAIANGYACAYPLGVVGIIGATVAVRYLCRVKLAEEEKDLESHDTDLTQMPHLMHLIVQNQFIAGHTILELHDFMRRDFVCSRILRNGELIFPKSSTTLELGDKVFIVCPESDKEAVQAFIGKETIVPEFEEQEKKKQMVSRRIVVTKPEINGKTPAKLHFASVYGVNLTRVTRQGMEIFARQDLPLQVGDRVMVVGDEVSVNRVSSVLGNAVKRLDTPNIATIFVGIILGIILGSIPFAITGILPVPLKLGIAGGPLIVAILIGRYGYKVHLVTYTTTSANLMLREIGLVLFLASVGIKAGAHFLETVVNGDGLLYVATGFLITIIPILLVGTVARKVYKFNYFTIMGMLAGASTDPPALAFANASCSKDAPSIGYSTVYPLSMFLRIFTAQLIVLLCCS